MSDNATERLVLTSMRVARGWSKSELARRARMTAADVGKIEAGRLLPYESQLRKLARALGVHVGEARRLLSPAPEDGA